MVPTGVLIGQITMIFATTLLGLWSATQWTKLSSIFRLPSDDFYAASFS
ncbi:hypothetical protein AAKU67_003807 [Oxalobacteraceae bacterium GrIS 2.11]